MNDANLHTSKESCDNPGCVACAYREAHPGETRWRIMQEMAGLIDIYVQGMASSQVQTNRIAQVTQALDLEAPLDELYSGLVSAEWKSALASEDRGSDMAQSLQSIFCVAFALMPKDVMDGALEMFNTHLENRIAEKNPTDEQRKGVHEHIQFMLKDIRRMGESHLLGTANMDAGSVQ